MVAAFTVVMVGMAALVVDVGALRDEQRQLQNGADAGALAVAQSCALGSCDLALAPGLADANSQDRESAVDSVSYPTANSVRVVTSSRSDGGRTTILPSSFAQAFSGVAGTTVRASATAAWGPPSSARSLPLAISECDLAKYRLTTLPAVLLFKKNPGCEGSLDSPGSFGWLDTGCPDAMPAPISIGAGVPGDTGASGPSATCLDSSLGKDVLLPVYSTVVVVNGKRSYTIVGFAALRLTGWRFARGQSLLPACGSSESCIAGTFIKYVTTSETGGGTDFGVSRVFLVR